MLQDAVPEIPVGQGQEAVAVAVALLQAGLDLGHPGGVLEVEAHRV